LQTLNDQDSIASVLVNSLATINVQYVNLAKYTEGTKFVYQSGSGTNEKSQEPKVAEAKAQTLSNAISIFNDIHYKHLHELQTPTYGGLMGPYSGSWEKNYYAEEVTGDTSVQKSQSEISNYYQSQGPK
jgi:hypothetical protein